MSINTAKINSKYGRTGKRIWDYRGGVYRYSLERYTISLGKLDHQSWTFWSPQTKWTNWFLSLDKYLFVYTVVINYDIPDFQKYLILLITNIIETDFEKFINIMETYKNTTIDIDIGGILVGFGEGGCAC